MKKISFDEVIKDKNFGSYSEEAEYILSLINEKKIKPIKNSGTNGKYPALYLKYWIVEEEHDDSQYIDELKYRLSTTIDIDFYVKHIDVYIKERQHVCKLSEYIENSKDKLSKPISENERSFDIWGREKFLSGVADAGVRAGDVLKHCSISKDYLNTYKTSEPISYFSFTKEKPQIVLITENLSPFYGMRKHILEGNDFVCGISIGTLIYGGGKRVIKAFDDFELCVEAYLCDKGQSFLYVGDIDYEGIAIYSTLADRQKNKREITPCKCIYEKMIDKVSDIDSLPRMKDQNRIDIKNFLGIFDNRRRDILLEILCKGRYIPQEILSVIDY